MASKKKQKNREKTLVQEFCLNYLLNHNRTEKPVDIKDLFYYFKKMYKELLSQQKKILKQVLISLYYPYFKNKFVDKLRRDTTNLKSQWLIQNIPLREFAQWELKSVPCECQYFENNILEKDITNGEPQKDWLQMFYAQSRREVIRHIFNKNLIYFIFWFFILAALVLAFVLGYFQNSLSPSAFIKSWWQFFFQR